MKKLFAKRWHSIPVAVISAVVLVCLLAGSAFAAYSFLSLNVVAGVEEPMVVSLDYDAGGTAYGWATLSSGAFDDWGVAGDSRTFALKIENRANNPITVATVLGGDYGYFTFTGFPNGPIGAESTWQGEVTVKVSNEAPAGTYYYTITFTRS